MRSENKKRTYEDKFARHFYCNSYRFTWKMKRENNKKMRRILKKDIDKKLEKWYNEEKKVIK